jgi:hypothetical protein
MKSRSWFFTWLKVLVCCWSVCWGSVNALATPKKGWRCEVCCPPTGCGSQGWDQYYKLSMYSHVVPANYMYTSSKEATKTQLLSAAQSIVNWANARKADGSMALATNKILALGETAFLNMQVNASNEYNNAAPFGNLIPVTTMNGQMNGLTQADKEAAWNVIATGGGLYQLVIDYANALTAYANAIGGKRGPLLPTSYFTTLIFVGAAIGFIGLTGGGGALVLLGAMVALGGTTGNMVASDFGE